MKRSLLVFTIMILIFTITACGNGSDGDGGGGKTGGGGNTVKIEMVTITAGSFTMGSSDSQDNGASPPHQVTLSKFSMSKYPVTQEQYKSVTGHNPSIFTTAPAGENVNKLPVEQVTWYDAVEFCNKLSEKEGLQAVYTITNRTPASGYPITSATVTAEFSRNGYRLPTEAQWEYACRAGTTTAYNTGASISDNTGWYNANSGSRTHEVGKKIPNAFGLYDMHGNVWEWCWDWYDSSYYANSQASDPTGAVSGAYRVVRGGSWGNDARNLRSAYRGSDSPYGRRDDGVGFRLVRP